MPAAGGLGERRAGSVQPREDRRDDAGAAQSERLADVGDAEPRRAARERGDGRAHGAVAVAVGLDDGDDLGAGEPAQVADVGGDRADVDRGLAHDAGGEAAHAPASPFGDDVRDREAGVVRHRQVDRRDALRGDELGGRAGEGEPRASRRLGSDLDVLELQALGAAERLDQRLPRGVARREGAQRQRLLGRAEHAVEQSRSALDRALEARDVDEVDADSDDHGHSPVATAGRGIRHPIARPRLLDRDGLREVAGLVDVEALRGRQAHREDVQRHDGEQRLEQRTGERDAQHLVGEAAARRRRPPRRSR